MPPRKAMNAKIRLTYRHQRQSRYSVRMPAEQQADGAAPARDGAIDAERLGALLGVGERRRQQRQRGRGEHRAEHALKGACADQYLEAGRRAADRRGDREADQADQERLLAADQVREPSAEQQQRTERERVRRHDPLAVAVGEAEVLLRGGQGDVHDGGVQDDHQLSERDHSQHPPAVGGAARVAGAAGLVRAAGRAGVRGGVLGSSGHGVGSFARLRVPPASSHARGSSAGLPRGRRAAGAPMAKGRPRARGPGPAPWCARLGSGRR